MPLLLEAGASLIWGSGRHMYSDGRIESVARGSVGTGNAGECLQLEDARRLALLLALPTGLMCASSAAGSICTAPLNVASAAHALIMTEETCTGLTQTVGRSAAPHLPSLTDWSCDLLPASYFLSSLQPPQLSGGNPRESFLSRPTSTHGFGFLGFFLLLHGEMTFCSRC